MRQIIAAIIILGLAGQVSAGTMCVSQSPKGTLNTGYCTSCGSLTTWGASAALQCYSSLRSATGKAVDGDQIWIKNGHYYSPTTPATITNQLGSHGIQIHGSFTGTETSAAQRAWGNPATGIIAMGTSSDTATTHSLYGWGADTTCTYHTCIDGINGISRSTQVLYFLGSAYSVLTGIETRNAYDAVMYNSPTPTSSQQFTVNSYLGQYNAGDIHSQSQGNDYNTVLSLNANGGRWGFDFSGAHGYVNNMIVDGLNTVTWSVGSPVVVDTLGTNSFENVIIRNMTINTSGASAIAVGGADQSPATAFFTNLLVNNITCTNISSGTPCLLFVQTAHTIISHSAFSNFTVSTGQNQEGLVLLNQDNAYSQAATLDFYDSQFTNVGYAGNNVFDNTATGYINLYNTTVDSSGVNNADSLTNAPVGYYQYSTQTTIKGGGKTGWGW